MEIVKICLVNGVKPSIETILSVHGYKLYFQMILQHNYQHAMELLVKYDKKYILEMIDR